MKLTWEERGRLAHWVILFPKEDDWTSLMDRYMLQLRADQEYYQTRRHRTWSSLPVFDMILLKSRRGRSDGNET